MPKFLNAFTAHPHAVGETYFQHMAFALRFSGRLFCASVAAFAHAFAPAICETTASQTVLDINDEIRRRRALMASGSNEAGHDKKFMSAG